MFFDVQDDVKIARRAAVEASFTQSRKTDARSVFHSGGNFCVHRPLAEQPAFAFAFRTRIGNHAARTLARRTGAGNAEEPLLIAHLPPSSTGTAGHGCFACRSTRTSAVLAGLVPADRNLGLCAEDSLLEL